MVAIPPDRERGRRAGSPPYFFRRSPAPTAGGVTVPSRVASPEPREAPEAEIGHSLVQHGNANFIELGTWEPFEPNKSRLVTSVTPRQEVPELTLLAGSQNTVSDRLIPGAGSALPGLCLVVMGCRRRWSR